MHKVLVVDDDKILQQSVREALEYHNFEVSVADNGKEAVNAVLADKKFDLVVMDVNMPEMDGITALSEIKKHDPSTIVIILTAYSNVSDAVRVVKEGAFNYLEKPINSETLVSLIKRALKARSLVETTAFSAPILKLGDGEDDKFVGESNAMKKVFSVIAKLAKVKTPVLIRGESGTGKELVARAIHYNGPRKDEKFVTINCGAIPENLIESELFGHEKGAFTGADARKIGKFQYANGGTFFLDEIGDLAATTQVKLLRVLQEKKFTPVGSNREISVDVRIIAASHKPFEKMIESGEFREDLFYRLNVLPVFLPPLRERVSDIPHLINYYIDYFNDVHDLKIKTFNPTAMNMLLSYSWPGNIRELRNVVEHSFIMESEDIISETSLPSQITQFTPQEEIESHQSRIDMAGIKNSILDKNNNIRSEDYKFTFATLEGKDVRMDFQVAKEEFEKQFIEQALKLNNGRINRTALNANIPKKTLLRKIEKYEINPQDYKEAN